MEPALSFSVKNLAELLRDSIIQEADQLSSVREGLRGFEEELEKMVSLLERSEHLSNLTDTVKQISDEAESHLLSCTKLASEMAKAPFYKKPFYWEKQKHLGRKLQEIRDKVKDGIRVLSENGARSEPERSSEGDGEGGVPRYLWRFINYLLLFPDDVEVPTRRIIALWDAQGLIYPGEGNLHESVDKIAERYLKELIERQILVVKKKKLNGKVQACSLGSGIRDTWFPRAEASCFFRSKAGQVRRLIDGVGIHDGIFVSIHIHGNTRIPIADLNYGDVVSFTSFHTQEGNKPGEEIGKFLKKCILGERFLWLRVLDLERVFRPQLPKTLGKLLRLKYLGLRWTYLDRLPELVDMLLELQVLDIKRTYITLLPKSIWMMKNLRHLYLSEAYRTRFPPRPTPTCASLLQDCCYENFMNTCIVYSALKISLGMDNESVRPEKGSLEFLQTLWGAFIDDDTCVKGGLDTLLNIRKLGVSYAPSSSSGDSENLKAVNRWISKLRYLESLRLKSRDKLGMPAHLHLTTLSENTQLSTVYLLGRLNPPVLRTFPEGLTDITLSGSALDVDPMEFLGILPTLQILRLLAHSVSHPTLHCSGAGFPQLKLVHIWNLENLEEWRVEEGSMPCLEEFEIRCCHKLVKLPHQLQNLTTLTKFKLTSMPQEFINDTKETLRHLWPKIDPPQP